MSNKSKETDTTNRADFFIDDKIYIKTLDPNKIKID